jgi:CheY-like chemotaxis protein/predicted regulator of Ras-like GTPase activity (Roadblock/LC7/MglB family)
MPRRRLGGEWAVAKHRILIIDSSGAFAIMLKEGVESSGPYEAIVVDKGTDALDVLMQNHIDLAIVDMGLEDIDGPTLVQSLRQSKPDLRILLIPLFGQELAEEEQALEVQGILPKPFFMGDLPDLLHKALTGSSGRDAEAVIDVPVEAPPSPRPEPPPAARRRAPAPRDMKGLLEDLFQEIRAEAVLFARGSDLIAHAGNVTQERAQELAELTVESLNTAHNIAAFLGETDGRFEQCTFEGDEYSVYFMNVTVETILSVALSARTPVGIVRYNLRRTVDALTDIWQE